MKATGIYDLFRSWLSLCSSLVNYRTVVC